MINVSEKKSAWLLTARPKTLILSCIPFLVGTLAATEYVSHIYYSFMMFGILSALCIQIATNFVNDVYDFKRQADKATRLGPKRGIQRGILTLNEVFFGALFFFALAFLFAIPLMLQGGLPIFILILISIFCGFIYTAGPFPLAYNGLGEVFVLLFFGLATVLAAFFFQTGFFNRAILILGLQLGFLASIPIAINNLRDLEEDKKAHKKTLAVRFGKQMARVEICFFIFIPFILNFYQKSLGQAFLPILTLPLGAKIAYSIWKEEPGERYNNFLAQSILLYVLFSFLWALALWL